MPRRHGRACLYRPRGSLRPGDLIARKSPRPTTLLLVTVPLPAKYANAIEPKMLYMSNPQAWKKMTPYARQRAESVRKSYTTRYAFLAFGAGCAPAATGFVHIETFLRILCGVGAANPRKWARQRSCAAHVCARLVKRVRRPNELARRCAWHFAAGRQAAKEVAERMVKQHHFNQVTLLMVLASLWESKFQRMLDEGRETSRFELKKAIHQSLNEADVFAKASSTFDEIADEVVRDLSVLEQIGEQQG